MSATIIKTDGAVIRQQKNTILKNVNLEIKSGEFVYIIGKVGSGKSSLLKTLYAELPLDYGKAEVAGFQLNKIKKSHIPLLRRKCGIVFQDFKLLTDRSVYDNLEFVLKATGWTNKKAIRERIDNVLEKVEMPDKKDNMPHQLSGGEQQRIVLARALLNAPPIIFADEPTGNIDPETSYRLLELLKDICANGKTIVIATHQYDLIQKYPGRVLRCENGEIKEVPELSVKREEEEQVTSAIIESPVETVTTDIITDQSIQEEVVNEMISESGMIEPEEIPVTEEMEETIESIETEEVTETIEDETFSETPEPEKPENIEIEEIPKQEEKKKKEDSPTSFGFELIE